MFLQFLHLGPHPKTFNFGELDGFFVAFKLRVDSNPKLDDYCVALFWVQEKLLLCEDIFMSLAVALILGALLWTFAEYNIHRFAGHEWQRRSQKIYTFVNIFRSEHAKHHFKKEYFASNFEKAKAALAAGSLIFTLGVLFVSAQLALAFTVGFILMYLYYEFFHRLCHVAPPKSWYGKILRKHHFYHHFAEEDMNHGVTTRFWDLLYGTYVKTNVVPINKKYTMGWLVEDESDDLVRSEYVSDYKIVLSTKYT